MIVPVFVLVPAVTFVTAFASGADVWQAGGFALMSIVSSVALITMTGLDKERGSRRGRSWRRRP